MRMGFSLQYTVYGLQMKCLHAHLQPLNVINCKL